MPFHVLVLMFASAASAEYQVQYFGEQNFQWRTILYSQERILLALTCCIFSKFAPLIYSSSCLADADFISFVVIACGIAVTATNFTNSPLSFCILVGGPLFFSGQTWQSQKQVAIFWFRQGYISSWICMTAIFGPSLFLHRVCTLWSRWSQAAGDHRLCILPYNISIYETVHKPMTLRFRYGRILFLHRLVFA